MKTPDLEFITVGRVLAPWGVSGKVKVYPETDFSQRFAPRAVVYVDQKPLSVESAEPHRGRMIIKFSSVGTIDEADKLRGKTLEIEHRQLQPLPADSYYHFQLIGLEVRTVQGEILGEITEIITTGSNDNYVVRNARGEILIPAIADVVKSVDIERGVMTIEAVDGLLDLNRKTV